MGGDSARKRLSRHQHLQSSPTSCYLYINLISVSRGGSRATATSKMKCFVIIVNGYKPLTVITKHSILDVAAVLDPPLVRDSWVYSIWKKNRLMKFDIFEVLES